MKVSITVIPGGKKHVLAMGESATVALASSEASLSSEGYTVTVNGEPATGSTVLQDGDIVFLSKNTKGN